MRVPRYPCFRFTFRKNVIINDIESRNFLGIWQDGNIVISLSAILAEKKKLKEAVFIERVSDVIVHEYLHHELFRMGIHGDHHWAIEIIIPP